ncbi:ribosome maturation factor RimP [bacterium]|nr:ribosome maturation factor RimP [bacterium]MBU1753034.1 ribosome maturation factor RimP [bacterium]
MTDIVSSISSVVEPAADALGLTVVTIEYHAGYHQAIVQIFVEKEGGIDIDDCTRLSRMVEHELDNIITKNYQLEVSSPGINRSLKKEADFLRYQGEKAKIVTLLPIEGRKNFEGCLEGVEDGCVIIKMTGDEIKIPLNDIRKAHLVPEINFNP